MANNPYVGDPHQGSSTSSELSGNPYVGDNYGVPGSDAAEEATETPGQEAAEDSNAEGRFASSEWPNATSQDNARHSSGAIATYQN